MEGLALLMQGDYFHLKSDNLVVSCQFMVVMVGG